MSSKSLPNSINLNLYILHQLTVNDEINFEEIQKHAIIKKNVRSIKL